MSPVLSVTERMVGWPGAGLVVGVYTRRTSPPPVNPGPPPVQEMRFRATDVSGQSLPQIVVREVDVPHEGAETYSQLDSAWVVLRTDGTYERRAFYSTWMSPNYRYSLGYGRVGRVNDYDHGRYARSSDGTLQLFSAYWQHRTATGIDLGDRVRLTQDMLAGDPVRPNVGYTRQVTP
jgi:hypothetical protein